MGSYSPFSVVNSMKKNSLDYLYHQGSEAEVMEFKRLQHDFVPQFEAVFPHHNAPKTVIIIPSLTLDQEILSKVRGHVFYEERMLCLMMLLRMPRTHITYVTSVPIDPIIIDYYLHLLPGITGYHARQRLTLLSCYDASSRSLTEKILERPRLIERIRRSIPEGHLAHLSCFNVTRFERSLSVKLGVPIYGCDPDLYFLGTKSKSRELFRECGLGLPEGFENLRDESDVIESLVKLKTDNPSLKRAVIKMDDGFSGEGNAMFDYGEPMKGSALRNWVNDHLPSMKCVADDLSYESFMAKFTGMNGIVEEYIEGKNKTSPSVQCRVNPLGKVDVISTHDQILGGESGQVFLGARFPADKEYAVEIANMGLAVASKLRDFGTLGRFSIDFLSVREKNAWKHYAIEINLRKGGTTHPFLMLQFLTDGVYDAGSGNYIMPNGQSRSYYATDNLRSEKYRGFTPHDLIEIAICNGLHYESTSQEGVMFHLIGALSQYGKLGVVCIGKDQAAVNRIYERTVKVLDEAKG
jgi:hypothetical protein